MLPLLSARAAIRRELVGMERRVGRLARQDEIARSLMTTPGCRSDVLRHLVTAWRKRRYKPSLRAEFQ